MGSSFMWGGLKAEPLSGLDPESVCECEQFSACGSSGFSPAWEKMEAVTLQIAFIANTLSLD